MGAIKAILDAIRDALAPRPEPKPIPVRVNARRRPRRYAMVMAVMIVGVILIGIIAPRWVVARMPSGLGVMVGCSIALILGAAFVWLAAAGFDLLGIEERGSAFDRGFNAWKIMIFLAPAAALALRRVQMNEG